jgi:alpha-L-rhamnosidase
MWERWNGDQMKDDPSMNSYNHYAYGAVADWIYRYAAGVDATPLDAGFHTIVLHPVFDQRLHSVAFDYASSYGPIHSDWTIKEDKETAGKETTARGTVFAWKLTIPANTTGWLPLAPDQAAKYKLDGVPLKQSKLATATTRAQQSGYSLQSGSYTFVVEP